LQTEEKKELKILENCYKSAEHENVVWVCDGAANVGQVGQEKICVGGLNLRMRARTYTTPLIQAQSPSSLPSQVL
jgi:uncharacterized metal-binding protein